MKEDYPGQAYFHEHNPRVKQAEERWLKEQLPCTCHDVDGLHDAFCPAYERNKLK